MNKQVDTSTTKSLIYMYECKESSLNDRIKELEEERSEAQERLNELRSEIRRPAC